MSFEEQIMPKEKYPSIFPSNVFRNSRGFKNWGISIGYSPVLTGVLTAVLTGEYSVK